MPGSRTLSFGTHGCNFRCSFCQNHLISQIPVGPDRHAGREKISSEEIVDRAAGNGINIIVSTYNEPLISSEWAVEIFGKAKAADMRCAYVSNGYATDEALRYIRPYVDFYKVDLKTFNPDNYLKVSGGELGYVLRGIEKIYAMGFWLEIVTLLVPGFNDSEKELRQTARFIHGVSPDIPWHITAFHPDHKMTEAIPTPRASILKARETGLAAGLKYVYGGNLRPAGNNAENTCCPGCGKLLVERAGFTLRQNNILVDERGGGKCPSCGTVIKGIWR